MGTQTGKLHNSLHRPERLLHHLRLGARIMYFYLQNSIKGPPFVVEAKDEQEMKNAAQANNRITGGSVFVWSRCYPTSVWMHIPEGGNR